MSYVLPSKYAMHLMAVTLASVFCGALAPPSHKLAREAGGSLDQQPTEPQPRTDGTVSSGTGKAAQQQPTSPIEAEGEVDVPGAVARTFSTVPGQDFELTFDVARFPESDQLEILIGDKWHVFSEKEIRTAHLENGHLFLRWKFKATRRTTILRFSLINKARNSATPPRLGNARVELAPVDLGTTIHQVAWAIPPAVPGKPTIIRLDKDPPSAMVGEPIFLLISLGARNIEAVVADRDYYIRLVPIGAEVTPNEVAIRKGEASAEARITSAKPALEIIRAESVDGVLTSTQVETSHCGSGAVQNLSFFATQEQAPADNRTPIPFSVDLTDNQGSPVSDGAEKSIDFWLAGVGRMISNGNRIPAGQCRSEQSVVSERVGAATVNAKLGTTTGWKQRAFSFFLPPLSFVEILCALLGGVAGAFVSAVAIFRRARRWRYFKWILEFVSGAIIGLCLFLAYYFGLTQLAHLPTSGSGLAFLCGTIGGFGGPSVLGLLRIILLYD